MDDADLVRKAQSGDRAAFEELVRRTSRLVYARCYLDSGDRTAAEDLAQETFLRAFRSIGQVVDPGGFRAWLLTIARSVAIDEGRRQTRRKRAAEPLAPPEPPDPSAELDAAETRARAVKVLESLPDEYRAPLMLRYFAGADYSTMSRQLGVSDGTLRGRLNRGMALLRAQMKQPTRRAV